MPTKWYMRLFFPEHKTYKIPFLFVPKTYRSSRDNIDTPQLAITLLDLDSLSP
jgi:hypothetical protein